MSDGLGLVPLDWFFVDEIGQMDTVCQFQKGTRFTPDADFR